MWSMWNIGSLFRICNFPAIMTAWFSLTLITTYSMAVAKQHTYFIFPYISDTGTYSPESCIFSQMINLGCILMVINMYVRYRYVDFVAQMRENHSRGFGWNLASLWFGIVGSLGMSIVANFQKTNLRLVHFFGADMALGGGVLYTMFQGRISYDLHKANITTSSTSNNAGRWIVLLRCGIGIFNFLLFFILVGFGYASEKDYEGDLIWWTPEDAGYICHIVATISEWIIVFLILLFILSYTKEFTELEFEEIKFKIKDAPK